jgi:hypothetical protein
MFYVTKAEILPSHQGIEQTKMTERWKDERWRDGSKNIPLYGPTYRMFHCTLQAGIAKGFYVFGK